MDVLLSFGQMGLGIIVLLSGAEVLVRGASVLALRFGISSLVVGLTVVAFGTSSPELVISVRAALSGDGGLAIGNVVGSNVANLALIVGLAAAIRPMPVHRNLVRWDLPVMLGSAIILVLMLYNHWLGRIEGLLLTAGIFAYIVVSILASRKETGAASGAKVSPLDTGASPLQSVSIWRNLLLAVGGLALLLVGANLLLEGAVVTAERIGVSQAVIGLTIVAVGTSLPELATTLVAAVRREGEIALGNAIGSNVFNTFGVLGPAALARPMSREGVGDPALYIMLGVSALTFFIIWTGMHTRRWEGFFLLTIYALYLWWIVAN